MTVPVEVRLDEIPYGAGVLSLLRTRRWLGFTALVVGAILAFGLLSMWQWSRAEERRLERLGLTAAREQPPMPLPGTSALSDAKPWQAFTTKGTYRADSSVLARLRYLGGMNGFWVLGALDLVDGRTLWVSRGWIPATGAATQAPVPPEPPSGEVTVVGSWLPFEAADAARQQGMPEGMVVGVAPGPLAVATSIESSVPGFLQAIEVDDPVLQPVPAPEVDEGRNISYAVQWLIFAAVALVGWWAFLRRESAMLREEAEAEEDPARSPAKG